MTVVTLYVRDGCHLCEEARAVIVPLAAEHGGLELREIDIETDERLLSAYVERIPVVEVDGREVSELDFDPDWLRRAVAPGLHTVGP